MNDYTPSGILGFAVVVAALSIGACGPYGNVVTLEPRPTNDSVAFRITGNGQGGGDHSIVYGLSVLRCRDASSSWTVASDGTRPMPDVVVYGQPLPGFVVQTPAAPLVPGCYQAVVSDAHPFRFTVDSAGRATAAP